MYWAGSGGSIVDMDVNAEVEGEVHATGGVGEAAGMFWKLFGGKLSGKFSVDGEVIQASGGSDGDAVGVAVLFEGGTMIEGLEVEVKADVRYQGAGGSGSAVGVEFRNVGAPQTGQVSRVNVEVAGDMSGLFVYGVWLYLPTDTVENFHAVVSGQLQADMQVVGVMWAEISNAGPAALIFPDVFRDCSFTLTQQSSIVGPGMGGAPTLPSAPAPPGGSGRPFLPNEVVYTVGMLMEGSSENPDIDLVKLTQEGNLNGCGAIGLWFEVSGSTPSVRGVEVVFTADYTEQSCGGVTPEGVVVFGATGGVSGGGPASDVANLVVALPKETGPLSFGILNLKFADGTQLENAKFVAGYAGGESGGNAITFGDSSNLGLNVVEMVGEKGGLVDVFPFDMFTLSEEWRDVRMVGRFPSHMQTRLGAGSGGSGGGWCRVTMIHDSGFFHSLLSLSPSFLLL